jgi:hypothetical protein
MALSALLRPGPNSPAAPEHSPDIAEHMRETPASEAPDGGVGEEALASVVQASRPGSPFYALALPMPRQPFPGQTKPPCEPEIQQKAINGGCWVGPLGTKKPPCGPKAFDYDDGCYMPVYDAPRAPTSEDPR